jgi:glutathione peroxidase
MTLLYQLPVTLINGEQTTLENYRNKVLLVVNTASRCGFTPQYAELENLYRQYREQGLEVLGFPCNQFRNQESGSLHEIRKFCEINYQVSFPMFAKIDVNGNDAHPLFRYLKREAPGILGTKAIKWNFTKFLVRRDGSVYKRYAPATKPQEFKSDIEKLLAEA